MHNIIPILEHTPTWVFGLLAALVAYGVAQCFRRTMTVRRTAVLPVALLALSFYGVISTFAGQPLALAAWGLGVAVVVLSMRGRVDTSGVRYSARSKRFSVPGSLVPLVLMLAIFSIKFGTGVALAMHPQMRSALPFALMASCASGVFSGAFLARSMALWSVARRADPAASATEFGAAPSPT